MSKTKSSSEAHFSKPAGQGSKRIHLSGFSSETKKELILQIETLGGKVDNSLNGYTDFLVCKSVLVEKFRIAKILDIRAVHSDWVKDSFGAGKFQEPEKYRFGVFQGLRFVLLGFGARDAVKIGDLILKHKGRLFSMKGCYLGL